MTKKTSALRRIDSKDPDGEREGIRRKGVVKHKSLDQLLPSPEPGQKLKDHGKSDMKDFQVSGRLMKDLTIEGDNKEE